MEIGLVEQIDIDQEMKQSYLSYAMSVIVARALPDARDGLKPVQRRILYAMYDMGLRPDQAYKKSARVVGEVLGKYHPHGEQAVYEAMVRMAQDFSLRYPLVDGQGNFGSIDGDAAAAMRYTEARMSFLGHSLLNDLEKETTRFTPNFDDSLKEPEVLPSTIPNLLVNGSYGIAVGMSTSIPPHNLGEVIDAMTYMLDQWETLDGVTVADLMTYIKGPDFPTGGIIFRYQDEGATDALTKAYAAGRGRVTVRARVHIEEMERNKSRIVITELPYQVNKANLMTRIADLHRDGRLEGLTDMRDESDRTGMRLVLETSRTVDPRDLLRELFKQTPMESTFSIIMLALVNGEPRVLSLKQALRVYIDHRLEIVRRRSEYDLKRARERAHILEGLLIALDNLDAVIEVIRRSRTTETAHKNLMAAFQLSPAQAQAILDMRLRRLAAMERTALKTEYQEARRTIQNLERLLVQPALQRQTVKEELLAMRQQYGDARRSLIVDEDPRQVVTVVDLEADQAVWVVVSEAGKIGRTADENLFKVPTRPAELPLALLEGRTRDRLYLMDAQGSAISVEVHKLPKIEALGEGVAWSELSGTRHEGVLAAAVVAPAAVLGRDDDLGYLCLASRRGAVKRIRLGDLPTVPAQWFQLMRLDDQDQLGWAAISTGQDELLLGTAAGQVIRFDEGDIRPMGLAAGGVAGIKLQDDDDSVIGMALVRAEEAETSAKKVALVWSITDNGLAKASPLALYPRQKRYGQGVTNMKLPREARQVVALVVGDKRTELYVKTQRGSVKRMRIARAVEGNRPIRPQAVVPIGASNRVVGVVRARPAVDLESDDSDTDQTE